MQLASKKVLITQSNYIPWKGYFDNINRVDECILLDSVQYTKRDWRNRNQIMGPEGLIWLTIPVEVKGKFLQKINQTKISDPNWTRKHWKSIKSCYAKAAFFDKYENNIEDLYQSINSSFLHEINLHFLKGICQLLEINTVFSWSTEYKLEEGKNEKIISLCKQAGATHYLTGEKAKNYLDEDLFLQENLTIEYADYADYPSYPNLHTNFSHQVSILDVLFNTGPSLHQYLKSFD